MSLFLTKAKQRGTSDDISLRGAFSKLVIICLSSSAVGLLLQLGLFLGLFQIANKPPPVLVQLQDGQSINVKAIDSLERTDEAILKFVNQILSMTFTWSGVMPSEKDPGQFVPDPGVAVVNAQNQPLGKITTAAWEATYAFEVNARSKFLQELVTLVPQSVFTNKANVAFVPIKILPPQRIAPGRWKVRVFSNLLYTTGLSNVEQIVPYNVDVYIHSVIVSDLNSIAQSTDIHSKALAATIAKARTAALEIEAIVPYRSEELK
ncbi:MAG: hypothetical protein ACRDEA_04615 [Microcystaceae cyanobacterium]